MLIASITPVLDESSMPWQYARRSISANIIGTKSYKNCDRDANKLILFN